MQPPHRLIPSAVALVLLAACSAPSASAEASASPGTDATDAPPAATAEPVASEDLADFSCDLPFVEQATVPRTVNITDVRIGSHDGYDRVVFEFTDGTPEIALERATPPFAQDASGLPMDVEGESFLRLIMRGGTKQMEDGSSSYDGSRDFDPGFPALVDLVEGGDFEAQSTWYFGLAAESCVRVSLLEDAPRLVIDIQH
ncbi:MAG: AMIN-like domain-containing (lipo)protein [Candidatus Limnocylindria bacterium]